MEKINFKKIKLLVATPLYPPEIGGPATYVKFLEQYLPKDQFEIDVVRFGDVKHFPYIIRHLVFFWKVFKRARSTDIVYALDPLGVGLPSGFAAKLCGKKFMIRIAGDRAWETAVQKWNVTDPLDIFSSSRSYPFLIRILKFGQTLSARMAAQIVVPSEYLRGIVSNWGIKKEKIYPVYNAFSPIEISESKEEIRRELSLYGHIILSAGRLVPWKGFETLIRSFSEMVENTPDMKLLIAGDGPDKEKLLQTVHLLDLEDKVIFLGILPKEKLLRYLKASDIFALNTFYEGFSHQLLEAMSLGTPVVTTTVGGNPEMIESGKDGILVTHDDTRAFTSVITLLLKEKKFSEDLAKSAKEKSEMFSVERATDGIVKLLNC